MTFASIQVHSETPTWAAGLHQKHFWCHATDIGEQLVAKLDGGILRFYGYDIGEFSLDVEQAETATEWVRQRLVRELSRSGDEFNVSVPAHAEVAVTNEAQPGHPITSTNFSTCELLWIASVLDAAMLSMRMRHSNTEMARR